MPLYLYGVVGGDVARAVAELSPPGLPTEHDPAPKVAALGDAHVAMLVSPIETSKVAPVRRNIEAHHRVVRAAFAEGTVIPMKFGHVAKGEKAVDGLLRAHGERFRSELARLDGKMEMGLRLRWDVENIFEHFVSQFREIRDYRDRIFGRSTPPSRNEQIELGRLFDQVRTEERARHMAAVLEVCEGIAEEHSEQPVRDEKEILNLALLIPRARMAEFEARVFRVAALFDNSFAFDYNGPWPPMSFVELELDLPAERTTAPARAQG